LCGFVGDVNCEVVYALLLMDCMLATENGNRCCCTGAYHNFNCEYMTLSNAIKWLISYPSLLHSFKECILCW